MFQNRDAQKPQEELYINSPTYFPARQDLWNVSVDNAAIDMRSQERSQHLQHEDTEDQDLLHKEQYGPWRVTPPLPDPSLLAFTGIANQPLEYYSPTHAGQFMQCDNQAGDFQTPSNGVKTNLNLDIPIFMPTSEASVVLDQTMFFSSSEHTINLHQYQSHNSFTPPQPLQQLSYNLSSFMHADVRCGATKDNESPKNYEELMETLDPLITDQSGYYNTSLATPARDLLEKIRFHVTLNAPTAMINHTNDISVSYLDKGRIYSISIIDTVPTFLVSAGARYRTFIRILFEDKQQRQSPETSWQFWKECRGINEAHQRDGKLQAVEYVEASQCAKSNTRDGCVELDTEFSDGFSVIWSSSVNSRKECKIAVRFNFLSTDFSHLKGVKGTTLRLCVKTECIALSPSHLVLAQGERVYCNVKLFRSHGADRKLLNDIAHIRKTIDKLKEQIAQAKTGWRDPSKSKIRGSTTAKAQLSEWPEDVRVQKRTSSTSSVISTDRRLSKEENLFAKLQTLQDMLTSTKSVTILDRYETEQDNADLHSVDILGTPRDYTKVSSPQSLPWQQESTERSFSTTRTTSLVFAPASTTSVSPRPLNSPTGSTLPVQLTTLHLDVTADVRGAGRPRLARPSDEVKKIPKIDDPDGPPGWIEAVEVDARYAPPPTRATKPVACFYIRYHDPTQREESAYHRAVYLTRRTPKALIHSIATKWQLEPAKIRRLLRVCPSGVEVEIDDCVMQEVAEGQDMTLKISQVKPLPAPLGGEMLNGDVWDAALSTTWGLEHAEALELRLYY